MSMCRCITCDKPFDSDKEGIIIEGPVSGRFYEYCQDHIPTPIED